MDLLGRKKSYQPQNALGYKMKMFQSLKIPFNVRNSL